MPDDCKVSKTLERGVEFILRHWEVRARFLIRGTLTAGVLGVAS
jgi:hypothetical protein